MDRGLIVQKILATKARDNGQKEHQVTLLMNRYGPGLSMGKQKLDYKWILKIENTPAHWYMSTLLEDGKQDKKISIYGNDWYCINFDEVMAEALTLI
jgi:hypothetical protein